MEQRETITPSNPLRTVLQEMGQPDVDVGKLGEALFDLSKALIPELNGYIERDRQAWRRATNSGSSSEGLFGMDEQYQIVFSTLASLGRLGGLPDYVFYLPDSGISRLVFHRDERGQLSVESTYNSTPEVKERFAKLSEELQQSPPVIKSGLLKKMRHFWGR